jgi:hypothetical protein
MSVPRFQFYFLALNCVFTSASCFGSGNGVAFYILSRKLEVKSQVGCSKIRNGRIERSPTSHHNLCFEVANSEVRLQASSSLSGPAARRHGRIAFIFSLKVARDQGE